ncbi:MAG TPA: copper transporter [Acidimicrobiales bacterium]
MINFRFHIVSLTAVLLALGIGLVLGTTFLDDATVNQLERQLEGLEHDLDAAQARNDEQQARLDAFEEEAALLDERLGERLYAGKLAGAPVLVMTTDGVDQRWVDSVMRSLTQADADVVGVWQLTERLTLDDEDEVGDLSAALQLSTDASDRLMDNLVGQLADVLFGAVDGRPDGDGTNDAGAAAGGQGAAAGDDAGQTAPAEPALLSRLREAGFVSYELPDGADGDVVRLPASGLRVVVVDGPGAALPAGEVLAPMLADLTIDGRAPVVATQPTVLTGDDVDEATQPQLVGLVRDDDTLSERVSTVDNLDQVSGLVSTLVATIDAVPGDPVIGRYGTGDGADDRLPPTVESG